MRLQKILFRPGSVAALLVLLMVLSGCRKSQEVKWYKGNLHTHSYWSDGDDYPEIIMQWYKDEGYDFVALSDHNILAEGEKWIEVKKGSVHENTFQAYLEAFGTDWVEFEEYENHFQVKLKTLDEYRGLFEEEGAFLIIKSEEITDRYENKPIHVNATNIQKIIEPQGGNSVADVMQNNIDAVLHQRQETGVPMFPHINHPNFGWAITAEDLKELEGERFFEIYNGHPLVHNYGDSLRSGTEQMWDEVLTHYLMEGKPPIFGIAVDDAHHYQEYHSERANPGRGWIHVKSLDLSPESLIAAMEGGDFYSSTGVKLQEVSAKGSTLFISVEAEEGVSYTTQFIGTLLDQQDHPGTLLKTVKGKEASYELANYEMYVRAKVISDKLKENPYQKGETEVAWTQPLINQK